MLLRSSSAPVLGSLLQSFSESRNKDLDNNNSNKHPSSFDHSLLKKNSISNGGHSSFSSFSLNPSHSFLGSSEFDRDFSISVLRGFRRARSDSNLKELVSNQVRRSSKKPNYSMLETIPSFSIYNLRDGNEDEDEQEEEQADKEKSSGEDGGLERSITIGDSITGIGSGDFNFQKNNMGSIEEEEESIREYQISDAEEEKEPASPPLYLARGLGIDNGGGGDFSVADFREEFHTEDYYKRMVEENPYNPLFLRNYAEFLYQTKGDSWGAEEYYSRAILVDPGDGEILSQYAKLVWELHHDHERASSYFEQSVEAAPEDSHVLAAYASFLWETEDDEEEDSVPVPSLHGGSIASVSA